MSNAAEKGMKFESAADLQLLAIRQNLLGRYANLAGPDPGPVAATLCAGLSSLSTARLMTHSDEETTTSALLGAMIASFQSARYAFPAANHPTPRFCWAGYRKGRTRLDWEGEAQRGADFALVVWTSKTTARVALFQAKRTEREASENNIHVKNLDAAPGRKLRLARQGADTAQTMATVALSKGAHFLDVHRRPYEKDKPVEERRPAQMKQLRKTGAMLGSAASLAVDGGSTGEAARLLSEMAAELPTERTGTGKDADAYRAVLAGAYAKRLDADKAFQRLVEANFASVPDDEDEFTFANADLHWIHYLAYLRASAPDAVEEAVGNAAKREAAVESAESAETMNEANASPTGEFEVVEFSDAASNATSVDEDAVCVPLLGLFPWLRIERDKNASAKNILDLSDVHAYGFSNVLLAGVEPLRGPRDGWLELEGIVVRALLPTLQDVCEVLMGDEHGAIDFIFGNNPEKPAPSTGGGGPSTSFGGGPHYGASQVHAQPGFGRSVQGEMMIFTIGPRPPHQRPPLDGLLETTGPADQAGAGFAQPPFKRGRP